MSRKKFLKNFAIINMALGVLAVCFAVTIMLLFSPTELFYMFDHSSAETEFVTFAQSMESDFEEFNPIKEDLEESKFGRYLVEDLKDPEPIQELIKMPQLDTTLPVENILHIPMVGIRTEILEGENYDKILEKGVLRVNEFGSPKDDLAMILAAHRYGFITWTSEYRDENSFYYLPDTIVGDTIEIIWEQRLYEYEIYKTEENTEITDYNADLILYTCKRHNSLERIFRYAKRIN